MFLRLLAVFVLVFLPHPLLAETPPNIVFILADDLGVNDLGCYGRKDHQTPHLDKLAAQGIRFTSAYAAQSVCSPTRAAIMTGLTPARLHLTTFLPGRADAPAQMLLHPKINQALPAGAKTLSSRLKLTGYTTGCIGKWHLGGSPLLQGFDTFHAGKADSKPSETEGGKGEFDLTLKAEEFIEQYKNKPFFLYLCHNNPHIGLAAQPNRIAKFSGSFNPLYAAVINTLDEAVGRVLAKLDELKLAENTIVIFTSDNGGLHVLEGGTVPTHNTPYRAGKGFQYEGGLRVPLLARWPGKIKPGSTCDVPVISTDWTPTIMAAASIPAHEPFDGENILPLLRGEKIAARTLYWHQPHYMNQGSKPAGAVREGNWKLIEHYENGALELYDLSTDVGEKNEIGEKHPAKVAELRGKLEKWRREIAAQYNEPNPAYNHAAWKSCFGSLDVTRMPTRSISKDAQEEMKPWRASMNQAVQKEAKVGMGAIILPSTTAIVHGEKLQIEKEPHKDTVGYWAVQSDWVEWKFTVNNAGTYEVELLQGAGKNCGGSQIEISIAGQKLPHTVKETGHFQRFIPTTIGTMKLPAGESNLVVRAKTKPGFAVMDLRRVTLRGVD